MHQQLDECPTCERKGTLHDVLYNDDFLRVPRAPWNGTVTVRGLKGHKCDACGETCITPDFIRHNERLINAARSTNI